MRKIVIGIFLSGLMGCGGGGSGANSSNSNHQDGNAEPDSTEIVFPPAIQRLPDELATFVPADIAQTILYQDLVELADIFSAQDSINAYNAIPDSIPYENSTNGCTYKSDEFDTYYVSVDCGEYTYSVEGINSTSWLILWLEDWTSDSRIFHRYTYKPEESTVTYIEKDYRGSAVQVDEALFSILNGAVSTEYSINYVE